MATASPDKTQGRRGDATATRHVGTLGGVTDIVRGEERVVVPERASAACGLAAWQGRAYLAWTGSDFRLNIASSADGARFEGKQIIPHRSYTTETTSSTTYTGPNSSPTSTSSTRHIGLAPALAAGPDGVYLAWTGTDRQLNVLRTWLGEGGHGVLDERSGTGPGLGAWGDDVVLTWAGSDTRVNVLRVAGAHPDKRTFDETTSAAPAVCQAGQDLLVAWTGTDRHLNIMATSGGDFGGSTRLAETSSHGPALCPYGVGQVLIAWTGSDSRLNLMVLAPGQASEPVTLDETTNHAPALCAFGTGVLLGWTGTDGRPNVTRLQSG
jgi:hypothetical protein